MSELLLALVLALGPAMVAGPAADEGELTLVETTPVETVLGDPEIPETLDVWLEMIAGAERALDLAFFYASVAPEGAEGRLSEVVGAIEAAAARGVAVRFLSDAGFHETYPETLDRLDALEGIDVRLYDLKSRTGGVLHAKYFVVDGREAYLGSANFDWRSLDHIQELGLRVEVPSVAGALREVFDLDWALAAGEPIPAAASCAPRSPVQADYRGETVRVTLVVSPEGLLPEGAAWDLPHLVEAIEAAETRVSVQLLSYYANDREGNYFPALENALRGAAARGVQVRLLLADWSKRRGSIESLKSLTVLPNLDVRLVALPEAESGFIPFARVVHAKFLAVDGRLAWVGTSNWSRDYFHASRNVGLLVEGERLAADLEAWFLSGWEGPYAEELDPGRQYEPPRIGR